MGELPDTTEHDETERWGFGGRSRYGYTSEHFGCLRANGGASEDRSDMTLRDRAPSSLEDGPNNCLGSAEKKMKIDRFVFATTIFLAVAGLVLMEQYYKALLENARGFIGCEDGHPVVRNITFGALNHVRGAIHARSWIDLGPEQCSDR